MSDYIASYYQQSLIDKRDCKVLDTHCVVDVCVVGGGLAGLTTARELAIVGKKVALLEQNKIGWGASGRNGGFVSSGFALGMPALEKRLGFQHAKALFDLSVTGLEYVADRVRDFVDDDLKTGDGWLSVSRHDDEYNIKRSTSHMVNAYGAPLRFCDTDTVRRELKSKRYYQGCIDSSAFHIHPLNYTCRLAKDAQYHGAVLYEQSGVVNLFYDGSEWVVETRSGNTVKARHVVMCGSAYIQKVIPKIERAILPVATYVITTIPEPGMLDDIIGYDGCIADTRRAGDYYRKVGNGRLLWGGRISTRRSEPRKLASLLKKDILSIYPEFGDFKIESAWSGLMGYCVHKMPLIGNLKPGLWVATGFGGHGLNTTAMAGKLIASAIGSGDDQYKLFEPFKAIWGGGVLGRSATQIAYWHMQLKDKWDERGKSSAS